VKGCATTVYSLLRRSPSPLWIGTTSGLSRWDARISRIYLQEGLSYAGCGRSQRTITETCSWHGPRLNRFHDGRFVKTPPSPNSTATGYGPSTRHRGHALDWHPRLRFGTRAQRQDGQDYNREGLSTNSIFQVLGTARQAVDERPLGFSPSRLRT